MTSRFRTTLLLTGLAGLLTVAGCTSDVAGPAQAAGLPTTAGLPDQIGDSSPPTAVVSSAANPPAGSLPSTGTPPGTVSTGANTRTVLVAPVSAVGRPAPGYRIVDTHETLTDCGRYIGHFDHDFLYSCSPSAASADTCFSPAAHRLLCLRDPWDHTLYQYALRTEPIQLPAAPEREFGLLLDNGQRCRIRTGDAAGAPVGRPDLLPYYFCTSGTAVWAKADQDPITRSRRQWTVLAGPANGRLVTRAVTHVYYVTTAE